MNNFKSIIGQFKQGKLNGAQSTFDEIEFSSKIIITRLFTPISVEKISV